MKDFNKPIRPINHDDDRDNRKKNIIEKNEEKKEKFDDQKKESNKKNFILISLNVVKNFFNFLLRNRESPSTNTHLKQLKNDLLFLSENNPKNNLHFAKKFAATWKMLISKEHDSINPKIKQLIRSFQTYMSENSQSLHFYLSNYSGEDWFPLPFFELIEMLHLDYLTNKKNSDLDRWLSLMDEILNVT